MRGQGAKLIEFGSDFQEAREHAQQLGAEQSLHFVPPFHRDFLKGVGTYWLELFSAVPDVDVAYVPIGMGSGICSGCAVRNGMNLKTKLVGVVSEGALSHKLSFEAGRVIAAAVTTEIADGVAVRLPDEGALEIMLKNVDHVVSVSDDEAREAMRIYFTATHNTVEGAGAISLAAAIKEKDSLKGKRAALVVSGGNVDREVFAKVLAG
jgi:threonine dehydratase